MPTTVNSRFLHISSKEQNISAGWSIRVLDYKDMKTLVAVVSEYNEFSFTQELNAPGTGSITIDDDSPFWGTVLENGLNRRTIQNRVYVFEAWDNGVPRFAWLGSTVTNTTIAEDETRAVTISGPGIGHVLSWASVWRPGWPTKVPILKRELSQADPTKTIPIYRETSYNDKLSAFLWAFPTNWSTMRMWYTVFRAAQRRGLLKFVSIMFTALKDSAKQDFQVVKTIETAAGEKYTPPELNQSLLDFLNDCTGQDYSTWFGQRLEWIMYPGFKLDVRRHIGTDRSKQARFFQGIISSDERVRDRENIRNRICVQDVVGNESNRLDNASVAKWNLREQWNTTHKNVTDDALRNQIADRLIKQTKDEKDQWTVKVPYDIPGRVPYRNFFVGDHIGVNVDDNGMTPNAIAGPNPMRVMAITISITGESTVPEVELTLQSLIDSRQSELEKQITQLINNPRVVKIDDLANTKTGDKKDGQAMVYNAETRMWEAKTVTATGGGGGPGKVWIGPVDPALDSNNSVGPGDMWLETYD